MNVTYKFKQTFMRLFITWTSVYVGIFFSQRTTDNCQRYLSTIFYFKN